MLRVDYHLHSGLSPDGRSSVVALCRRAVALGMSAVAFTEDAFLEAPWGQLRFPDEESYCRQVQRAREEFGDKLMITMGVEVDFQARYQKQITSFLAGREYDYVLGAVHFIDGKSVETEEYFAGRSEAQVFGAYFEEVTRAVESGLFDGLAHLDLVKCSAFASFGQMQAAEHARFLEPLLAAMVERGLCLEVNSSGLKSPARETCPSQEVLHMYRQMGGKAVTVGSDARNAEQVGFGIEQAASMLRREGFETISVYEKRKPRLIALD